MRRVVFAIGLVLWYPVVLPGIARGLTSSFKFNKALINANYDNGELSVASVPRRGTH